MLLNIIKPESNGECLRRRSTNNDHSEVGNIRGNLQLIMRPHTLSFLDILISARDLKSIPDRFESQDTLYAVRYFQITGFKIADSNTLTNLVTISAA